MLELIIQPSPLVTWRFSHHHVFSSILSAIAGVAMHPPTLKRCIDNFAAAHLHYQKLHPRYLHDSGLPAAQKPKELRPPTPSHVSIIAQHLHDRMAPWRLTDVLLTYLFNHGISVIPLHDDIQSQRNIALSQAIAYVPKSKFGRYRHNYEWLLPALKSFSPTTLLSRGHVNSFLKAFTYDELDKWEGAVTTQYSTDLQDLLFALLSYWGAPPLPAFAAQHDALGIVLMRGVHRFPDEHESRFHISRAPHDTPASFYTRAFLHPLRFPALAALNLPVADIQAIELATRNALLALPLLQALDFLHTQLIAGLCVASPSKPLNDRITDPLVRYPPPVACRLTPPREAPQAFHPPKFRCWLGKKISPNMSVLTLKCDSVPWANYFVQGSGALTSVDSRLATSYS